MSGEAFRLDHDNIYRCDLLRHLSWLRHGFGTRLASPEASVTLRQVHSNMVRNAAGLDDRAEEGDGLVTDCAGLSIGVRTADCVPLLLCDVNRRTVAAVHAGWRGTAERIAAVALRRMEEWYGTAPVDVVAAIGPCIQRCCYTVGADVARRFAAWAPELQNAETVCPLNLAAANQRQLQDAGVPATQIAESGLCTACNPGTLFSYRREPHNPGRMVAAICRLE